MEKLFIDLALSLITTHTLDETQVIKRLCEIRSEALKSGPRHVSEFFQDIQDIPPDAFAGFVCEYCRAKSRPEKDCVVRFFKNESDDDTEGSFGVEEENEE